MYFIDELGDTDPYEYAVSCTVNSRQSYIRILWNYRCPLLV